MSYQLSDYLQVSPPELYAAARETRRQMEGCMARLGLQLLALEHSGFHRDRGCSSIVQFAVRNLQLSGKKAYELLRATRALLKLPILAAAFASGEVGWGKIREITRVATPETETSWLAFALVNDSDAVQRRVSMSPAAYRRHLAATESGNTGAASRASSGFVEPQLADLGSPSRDQVSNLGSPGRDQDLSIGSDLGSPSRDQVSNLGSPGREQVGSPGREPDGSDSGEVSPGSAPQHSSDCSPALERDLGEPLIQVVFRLTPAQLALYERAEERVRQRRGRRLPRAEVLVCLAEETLASAAPRTRARLPVLVRVDAASGQGWLETRQGLYPARSEQVEAALAGGKVALYACAEAPPVNQSESGQRPARESADGAAPPRANGHSAARPAEFGQHASAAAGVPGQTGSFQLDWGAVDPGQSDPADAAAPPAPYPAAGTAHHGQECSTKSEPQPARAKGARRRRPVSVRVLQALWQRSGGRCEVVGCGAGAPLHVHHEKAVSDGGDNSLAGLSLRCAACHGLHHEPDFHRRPDWRQARDNRRRRQCERSSDRVRAAP